MARPTNQQRLNEIHEEAMLAFDEIQSASRDERIQSLQDRRFYSISGAQWEDGLQEQFTNRPRFEVNKVHMSVIRIVSEYRNNRITVDFEPTDGAESDALADICDKLYRADEHRSGADEAYDNGFEEAVGGGMGAFRMRAGWEDEEDPEDERQRIFIEPVHDADTSVFFDLQAKRQDKADARYCFVLESITYNAYKERFNDDPASWPKQIWRRFFDWSTPDVVYIADYYVVEHVYETIYVYRYLDGSEERLTENELEDKKNILSAVGARKVREKRISKKKVHKYLLSGSKVLEDQGYIAGSCIPIIPIYGKRWFVDNIERFQGQVRLAKDTQRLKNMQLSKLGEIAAFSAIEKPIMTAEQVSGYQNMWAEDNVKNFPYLLIHPLTDANGNEQAVGPLAYTKPPQVPPAMAAILQITEADMKDILGNTQQGEEITGNISTETAQLISNRLDMQTFIYMSNMAKSIKRGGEVWLGMAKDLYYEENRKMKGVGLQGETEQIVLKGKQVFNKETGKVEYENDLSKAKYDVVVSVGPASATRRASTLRSLIKMIQISQDPATIEVLSAMAMMNMDGEGIEEAREYFRDRLVRMGVMKPTQEEAEKLAIEMQAQGQDAQTEYLQSAAMAERARAENSQADVILKQAKTDKTRADTAETLSGIERDNVDQAMEVVEKLGPRIEPEGFEGE